MGRVSHPFQPVSLGFSSTKVIEALDLLHVWNMLFRPRCSLLELIFMDYAYIGHLCIGTRSCPSKWS